MIKYFKKIRIALTMLITLTLLTGLLYPMIVTGLSQLLFPSQANGSLVIQNNKIIGSALIGQYFSDPRYFWGRPSTTTLYPYNAASSSGSNMALSNQDYMTVLKDRIINLKKTNPNASAKIPADLITASGSGLDPDISPLAAYFQVHRIAKARKISEDEINTLIKNTITPYSLGILGEPRVNVLRLNLALDELK